MDSYFEQIVFKKASGKDRFMKVLIIFAGAVLAGLFLLFVPMSSFMLLGAAASVYLTKFVLGTYVVEYEYIITNNEFDIDKIVGRKNRKRLITLKLNRTEEFGVYEADKLPLADVTVDAHDGKGENLWYLLCPHEKHGKTLLLFSPNDKLLYAVNTAVPARLRIAEIKKPEDIDEAKNKEIEKLLNPIAARENDELSEISEKETIDNGEKISDE